MYVQFREGDSRTLGGPDMGFSLFMRVFAANTHLISSMRRAEESWAMVAR